MLKFSPKICRRRRRRRFSKINAKVEWAEMYAKMVSNGGVGGDGDGGGGGGAGAAVAFSIF